MNRFDQVGVVLDVKQKQFANTILDGDTPIVLNSFQKEVYSAFDDNQTITISVPTSAGKSFILLHLLTNYIQQNPLPFPFSVLIYIAGFTAASGIIMLLCKVFHIDATSSHSPKTHSRSLHNLPATH